MKIHFEQLTLGLRKAKVVIPFSSFNFFYGKMGAGKSSIVRLIDFSLGGGIELTPVLQQEFVSVTLNLVIEGVHLSIFRQRDSQQVVASWAEYELAIPARRPQGQGEILEGTGVQILSDLIFYLAGVTLPKVRRSKLQEDSAIVRLSFRDLFWYCYLDQDNLDSNFFNLDSDAFQPKRLKSRDVLRYTIGFYQERVTELESQLEEVRTRRLQLTEGARALEGALELADVEDEAQIIARIETLRISAEDYKITVANLRNEEAKRAGHIVEILRSNGREISLSIEQTEEALDAAARSIQALQRHRNEIQILSVKFQRAAAARAVLNGVTFDNCPRCAQTLPEREDSFCAVCGQSEPEPESQSEATETAKQDVAARLKELGEAITLRQNQRNKSERQLVLLEREKQQIDSRISEASANYDSPILSQLLNVEYERASAEQEIRQLERLQHLPARVISMREEAATIQLEETAIRESLKLAREAAERDTSNLRKLEELFLDCLVRAKIPGITEQSSVHIVSPEFLPEVRSPQSGEMVVDSFANTGSAGKKTLFKCCFALALHRLSVEISANLPTILIIDTPMKNISSQENPEQFEGFYNLLYELSASELAGTQFVVIDNEFFPPIDQTIDLYTRHMTLNNSEEPPLVPYLLED